MELDVVERMEIKKSGNAYRVRQAETFEKLGTKSEEWKPVPIKDIEELIDGTEVITFDYPEGLTEIRSMFPEDIGLRCQLCGHPIEHKFYLYHTDKRFVLQVGSVCVDEFMGAGYTTRMIKVFKDNKIRQKFRDWKDKAILNCEAFKQGQYWLPPEIYKLRKQIINAYADTTTSRKLKNLMERAWRLWKVEEQRLGRIVVKQEVKV